MLYVLLRTPQLYLVTLIQCSINVDKEQSHHSFIRSVFGIEIVELCVLMLCLVHHDATGPFRLTTYDQTLSHIGLYQCAGLYREDMKPRRSVLE